MELGHHRERASKCAMDQKEGDQARGAHKLDAQGSCQDMERRRPTEGHWAPLKTVEGLIRAQKENKQVREGHSQYSLSGDHRGGIPGHRKKATEKGHSHVLMSHSDLGV